MSTDIVVNSTGFETRIAFTESGRVTRFLVERESERGPVGNIYKGKIVKVLPGMQACFVDIGLEKAAFLYVDDIIPDFKGYDLKAETYDRDDSIDNAKVEKKKARNVSIAGLVREGEKILVQILKEPIGTKGARVTTHLTIAGRFLVYMPTVAHTGVSRRIESAEERARLKEIVESIKKKRSGFIVRTLAEGVGKKAIRADMIFLEKVWKGIKSRSQKATVGKLVYQELDLLLKTVRDYFSHDINSLIVDNRAQYRNILKFVETFSPDLEKSISLYTREEGIFDFYTIESAISRAFSRKIWLKSGGYIVIDQTEALVAIDVNSGRYVGKRNLEDTILKINMEAVEEIFDQLKVRNIGGIIILDFIDMEKENNREKVFNHLREALKSDKARTTISKISEIGIVQMTRQRVSPSLCEVMCSSCPYCDGDGYVKSAETMAYEILRSIRKELPGVSEGDTVLIHTHPDVAKFVYEKISWILENYEKKSKVRIVVEARDSFHIEQFETSKKSKTRKND